MGEKAARRKTGCDGEQDSKAEKIRSEALREYVKNNLDKTLKEMG
jgi:hypothetical protein